MILTLQQYLTLFGLLQSVGIAHGLTQLEARAILIGQAEISLVDPVLVGIKLFEVKAGWRHRPGDSRSCALGKHGSGSPGTPVAVVGNAPLMKVANGTHTPDIIAGPFCEG